MSYSTWINVTRGDDPLATYNPVKHYAVNGHALCNQRLKLVEDQSYVGFYCKKCLKKLKKEKVVSEYVGDGSDD